MAISSHGAAGAPPPARTAPARRRTAAGPGAGPGHRDGGRTGAATGAPTTHDAFQRRTPLAEPAGRCRRLRPHPAGGNDDLPAAPARRAGAPVA